MNNFQRKGNPFSNTYNEGWRKHQNFYYKNNKNLNPSQEVAPVRKPSALEETLNQFMKKTQNNFEAMNKDRELDRTSLKKLEVQIGQIAWIIKGKESNELVSNKYKESCKAIKLRNSV